jgi:hypothetical protein
LSRWIFCVASLFLSSVAFFHACAAVYSYFPFRWPFIIYVWSRVLITFFPRGTSSTN